MMTSLVVIKLEINQASQQDDPIQARNIKNIEGYGEEEIRLDQKYNLSFRLTCVKYANGVYIFFTVILRVNRPYFCITYYVCKYLSMNKV